MKWGVIHDSLLRGGCCAVCVSGGIIAFYNILYSMADWLTEADERGFIKRALVSLAVTAVAAAMRVHLVAKAQKP